MGDRCCGCKKRTPEPARTRCRGCLDKARERMAARVLAGRCRRCNARPPAPGRLCCPGCLATSAGHMRAKRLDKPPGACVAAGCCRPATAGCDRCLDHEALRAVAEWRRAAKRIHTGEG